jgi:putative YpdA family bacillithiol system oxidoreductase
MLTAAQIKLAFYFAPLLLVWLGYIRYWSKKQKVNLNARQAALTSGLAEPVSLHPRIDVTRCIGCGACVNACPEDNVLGLINTKAELINPSHCIGHGACKASCPVDAISLVFGSETRGVDIPVVKPDFETNVPGIFIAGELGGMGLIRNAVEQGRQSVESIRHLKGIRQGNGLDVVIVGAGPAGIAASLAAAQHNLRFVTIEQDSLGGTVSHYPRGKIVMTAPVHLPIIGKVKMKETTKEALLAFWVEVESRTNLKINYHERVEEVTRRNGGFTVKTSRDTYQTRAVLLAIGRRGTPRRLGIPGEDLSKVVYRLIDPEQYRNQHVLIVGGGDSALEASLSIADVAGTTVTLSYRSETFSRAREKNRIKIQQAENASRLKVLMKSHVREITANSVKIEQEGEVVELPNDVVIICAGGVLPTPFLKSLGIEVETKYGTA